MPIHVPDNYGGAAPTRIGYLRSGVTLHLAEVWLVPPGVYVDGRPMAHQCYGVWAVWPQGLATSLGVARPSLVNDIPRYARHLLGHAKREQTAAYRKWAWTRAPDARAGMSWRALVALLTGAAATYAAYVGGVFAADLVGILVGVSTYAALTRFGA